MEEIHTKMTPRLNEMKLYMEVADKPINSKVCNYYTDIIILSDFFYLGLEL